MRTFTIEVPDHLAERLDAMPPETRNHFAVAALLDAVEDEGGAGEEAELPADFYQKHPLPTSLSQPLSETARQVNADIAAGRIVSGDTFLAELRRMTGRSE